MRPILFAICFISINTIAFTQTTNTNCCDEKPYVEVTGSAEMEIVPDEIYITTVLYERYDGKTKITIDKMETDMFAALKNIGIDAKNISLADAGNNFVYRKRKDDDALLSRNYTILVNNAASVIKVFDELGKMDAYDAYISKTSHSKIEEFRMQTKVNATIAAKEKANKMLTAIGGEIGKPILIQEINNSYQPYEYSQLSNTVLEEFDPDYEGERGESIENLTYQKIKIRYEIFGRFEIK
ncbi:MAG: SIMPL domain-containing protein [Fimbriimonadaceae bacterium]|nr:SIMPL domain-containing protein [Chitinophagales bacterium]